MTDRQIFDIVSARGMTGVDAETAIENWRLNPEGSDGCRVQRMLEAEGVL